MALLDISIWDWFTLGLYLVGITILGVWTANRIKDTTDFFLAGRRMGKALMVFFSFGSGTSGNQAVGVAAKTYTNGFSGIWFQWLYLFPTPFYWIIGGFYRRMRALTVGDFFEYRYGPWTAVLYSFMGILQFMAEIGVMMLGAGTVIEAVSGIDRHAAVLVMTVLFVIYGIAGGLHAAILTDFIQGVLTIVLSFMLLPFALNKVGGMAGLHEKIADEHMFSLAAPGEITTFYIVMVAMNALIGIVTQPHILSVCSAGRTELDGRIGFAWGSYLKRLCTVAWMITGLCAVVMYKDLKGDDVDLVFGMMARDLLPAIMPGLVGLFLAALLASVMSTADAGMVAASGLFTQNVYKRLWVKDKDQRHYVLVGRIASLFAVAGCIAFAYLAENVRSGLETFWKIQALMGAAFWIGLYWRRATPAGAWVGTLGAFAVMLLVDWAPFHAWAAEHLPEFMLWEGKLRLPWQMVAYLSTAFGGCIIVSLLTRRLPKAKLDRVYTCLHTPVIHEEPHSTEPFTIPEGIEPGPPRKLINHPDLEFPVPTKAGVYGFLILWVFVGLLVGFVYWLSGVGA